MAHSPVILLDTVASGTGTPVDLDGRYKHLALSYQTSDDLLNNGAASVIVEVSDDTDGPWFTIGGFSPGPAGADAGRYVLSQGTDGIYRFIRGRVENTFSDGTVTVILYFDD